MTATKADSAGVGPIPGEPSVREIRVDPLSGLRVLIAPDRAGRPGGGWSVDPAPPIDPATDPFGVGHEEETPPEIARRAGLGDPADRAGFPWSVRTVPNLYPAVVPDPPVPAPHAVPALFRAVPARGAHEIIINAPDAVTSLAELEADQVAAAMTVWRERMRAHPDAACRHLIVNERAEAGASLPHTHAQLYALDFVPAAIARERERFGAYATQTMGGNLLADVLQHEVRERVRMVAYDDEAVLLAPYASRAPFQLMLIPRDGRARFEDDGPLGAALLHDGLSRLARRFGASPPLNLWVRTAPSGAETFTWRIDIVPRLSMMAGLELGAGVHVCTVAPEDAAAQLRAA